MYESYNGGFFGDLFKSKATWETCHYRKWLNSSFIDNAFIPEEKNRIIESLVKADPNPKYETPQGNDTYDRIFLLSYNEFIEYEIYCFEQCKDFNNEKCNWWFRTMGAKSDRAMYTDSSGYYRLDTITGVIPEFAGIRPAMWISLDE